jgi:ubiquitin-conjugating enzyme E2 G2
MYFINMVNKRLLKEVNKLIFEQNSKNLLDNDYLVAFDESNINKILAIIKPPKESVYRHKFIRLNFDIPFDYPHSPPKVTFINYDGVRIHPNMYCDGKCCATILNTWPSDNEKWTSSMGIETILLVFHSFLDNHPYIFEPGERDNESYTTFVLYQTWQTCLIRYITTFSQPSIFTEFINNYLLENVENIFDDLDKLNFKYPPGRYYTHCFEIDTYYINYPGLIHNLENIYQYIDYTNQKENNELNFKEFLEIDYKCNICFDTIDPINPIIQLSCKHTFHKKCLFNHNKNNGNICSLCRKTLSDTEIINTRIEEETFTINPITNRRIKIGGKVYLKLIKDGVNFNH